MADIAGHLLDLYTSSAGKRLGMELLSAPLVSIAADGHVETHAQLRWGPSQDDVLMEGSLRDLGDGELELTAMSARSSALGLSSPPLQPARRLRVVYADRELLVLMDREGAVDALWREGGGEAEAPEPDEIVEEEGGGPLPTGDAEPVEERKEEEKKEEELERLEEELARLEEREAAAQEKIEGAASSALRAIDAKLEALENQAALPGAKRQLKKFEDRFAAKLQKLDAWWEKLADHQAKAKEAEMIVLTAAVEVDQKLKRLQDANALSEAKAEEAEDRALKAAAVVDKKLEELKDADANAEATAEEAEERALKAAAEVDKQLNKLKDADVKAEASAGAAYEEHLARFKRAAEQEEAYLQERMAEFNAAVEAISHAREAWDPREEAREQLQEAEDAARRRLEAAAGLAAERAGERLEEKGRDLGESVFRLLRAESERLEKRLDERFSVLSGRLEELQARAPRLDESLREELRAELEALRGRLEGKRPQQARRRWPWSP